MVLKSHSKGKRLRREWDYAIVSIMEEKANQFPSRTMSCILIQNINLIHNSTTILHNNSPKFFGPQDSGEKMLIPCNDHDAGYDSSREFNLCKSNSRFF